MHNKKNIVSLRHGKNENPVFRECVELQKNVTDRRGAFVRTDMS